MRARARRLGSDALLAPADADARRQAFRYLAIGAVGYVLAMACYALELEIGIPPYPAVAVVFVLNGLFNFVMMRIWAFPASGGTAASELLRFTVVAAGSLVINYATFALCYSVMGLAALLAQAIAIVVAAPFGFVANRLWSFGERR